VLFVVGALVIAAFFAVRRVWGSAGVAPRGAA
jgi:hypothetical protein